MDSLTTLVDYDDTDAASNDMNCHSTEDVDPEEVLGTLRRRSVTTR